MHKSQKRVRERAKPKAFHIFSARVEGGRRVKKGSCRPRKKETRPVLLIPVIDTRFSTLWHTHSQELLSLYLSVLVAEEARAIRSAPSKHLLLFIIALSIWVPSRLSFYHPPSQAIEVL